MNKNVLLWEFCISSEPSKMFDGNNLHQVHETVNNTTSGSNFFREEDVRCCWPFYYFFVDHIIQTELRWLKKNEVVEYIKAMVNFRNKHLRRTYGLQFAEFRFVQFSDWSGLRCGNLRF